MTNRVFSALAAFSLAGIATIGIASPLAVAGRQRRRQSPVGLERRLPESTSRIARPSPWPFRSPATACSAANQTSGSVSLVDIKNARVLHELKTGDKPAGVALSRDGHRGVVTHWFGYDLAILDIKDDKIALAGRFQVGPEPRGVAMTGDGSIAFVAVGVSNELVRVDLNSKIITGRLAVGREPRGVALSPDESQLLVGNSRSQDMSLVDSKSWKVSKTIPIDGDNLRQVAISPDGKFGYVANMKNRRFPTTKNNIDLGWVLGQRLTRIDARWLGDVRHAFARHPGQGRERRTRSRDQPRPEIRRCQLRRNARGHDLPDRLEPSPLAAEQLARPDRARAAQERRPAPAG